MPGGRQQPFAGNGVDNLRDSPSRQNVYVDDSFQADDSCDPDLFWGRGAVGCRKKEGQASPSLSNGRAETSVSCSKSPRVWTATRGCAASDGPGCRQMDRRATASGKD